LGIFVEHLVCNPKIKGLETPFKSPQLPAKTKNNQSQQQWAQSKSGFVPKINETNGEKWVDLVMLGFGFFVEKMEMRENGGRRWVERGRRW
jgi:hypothetical protein